MRQGYRLSVPALTGTALALVLLASSPAPGWATTLREALVNAYQTNPDLEASRALLRATDELVPQALAGYRPSLFLNGGLEAARGNIGRGNRSGGLDASQSSNRTSKQVSLSVRQNLYAGGSTAAGVRQAENQVSAERANLISTEQQVLLAAITAYTDVWRDKSVLDLALNNEQRLRRQLRATRDRFEVGEVARTDVAQAEARLSRARADIETAKANLAASQAQYRQVIGSDPGVLEDPQPAEGLPPNLEQALAIAANNPDIINATYSLAAAREAVDVAYGTILPSLDLESDLSYADQPNSTQPWQDEASIGLNLTIPLYQGGSEYSQIRQAREQALQIRSNLASSQRSVRENVSRTWDQVYAARAAIRSFQDEVKANRIALEGVQQEALVGSRTVLDVLDAEQELFTSQVNLVRARRDYVVVTYQLKAAIGELTVDDLKLGIETYNPVVYYERNRTRLFGLDGGR
jgi:TolC family type I secretion outer membrane protein